jgi:hypothetical protein
VVEHSHSASAAGRQPRPETRKARQARLALNIYARRTRPTLKALATLGGLSVQRLYQLRYRRKHNGEGRKHNGGTQSIPNGNGRPAPSLAELLVHATADERIEAARALGVDIVWDTMVLPLVVEDKASQQAAV